MKILNYFLVMGLICSGFISCKSKKSGEVYLLLRQMNLKNLTGILLIICLNACKKETIYEPELIGNLVGYILTSDENAFLLDDHSGVSVTAFAYGKANSTKTDRHGRFELMHLPAGTYELYMEKKGFGTFKQFGVRHLGGMPTTLDNGPFCMYELSDKDPVSSLIVKSDTLFTQLNYTNNWNVDVIMKLYFSSTSGFLIAVDMLSGITIKKHLALRLMLSVLIGMNIDRWPKIEFFCILHT